MKVSDDPMHMLLVSIPTILFFSLALLFIVFSLFNTLAPAISGWSCP